MKRPGFLLFLLFPLIVLLMTTACDGTPAVPADTSGGETAPSQSGAPETDAETLPPEPEGAFLHTIAELNTAKGEIDDHAGEQDHSSLELDWRSAVMLTGKQLRTLTPYYPRIKKAISSSIIPA